MVFAAFLRVLKSVATKYNELLVKRPLRTSVISATLLYGIGDYISQIFLEGKFREDTPNRFLPDFERL